MNDATNHKVEDIDVEIDDLHEDERDDRDTRPNLKRARRLDAGRSTTMSTMSTIALAADIVKSVRATGGDDVDELAMLSGILVSRLGPKNRTVKRDLKDMGAAFAVVSIFLATLGVGLLSFTHDVFSDRPEDTPTPTSTNAITALLFISVIFAVVAAVEFTVLQISSAHHHHDSPENHESNSASPSSNREDADAAVKDTGNDTRIDIQGIPSSPMQTRREEKSNLTSHPELRNIPARSKRVEHFREIGDEMARLLAMRVVDGMATTSLVLLSCSCATLFAAIFTFIWSNEPRSVGIAVSVVFGVLCIRPLRDIVMFGLSHI